MDTLLVVDNGSVYTKNLVEFLKNQKINFTNISFEEISNYSLEKFDSIILSGRRKNDKKMNSLNSMLIKHAVSNRKKLLGICYGAEILALTLGGTIKKINSLQKGEEDIETIKKNPLCAGKITVYESHSYEVSKLGDSFLRVATSKNCLNEIIKLDGHNIFGTQFHPEMSDDGKSLIRNFVAL